MRHVDEIRGGLFPEPPFIGDHEHPSRLRQGDEVAGLCNLLNVPPGMAWGGPGLAFIACIYIYIYYNISTLCKYMMYRCDYELIIVYDDI